MKKILLLGALILVLITAACGANRGASPTLVGTSLPEGPTNTPFGGLGTGTVVAAQTASALITPTAGLETPMVGATQSVATQAPTIVGSPAVRASQTAVIPVTGLDIMPVECQFCVDNMANALLVLPDTATFEVVSPSTTTTTGNTTTTINTNCSTIEVNNGKQVVLCSGPDKTAINLNVCVNATNGNTCTNYPLQLLACPLTKPAAPAPSAPGATYP
jgi:hypothetical protein